MKRESSDSLFFVPENHLLAFRGGITKAKGRKKDNLMSVKVNNRDILLLFRQK